MRKLILSPGDRHYLNKGPQPMILIDTLATDIPRQLAVHRAAVAETRAPIQEAPAAGSDVPGAVALWAPEGVDLQTYMDALERAAWLALEQPIA